MISGVRDVTAVTMSVTSALRTTGITSRNARNIAHSNALKHVRSDDRNPSRSAVAHRMVAAQSARNLQARIANNSAHLACRRTNSAVRHLRNVCRNAGSLNGSPRFSDGKRLRSRDRNVLRLQFSKDKNVA